MASLTIPDLDESSRELLRKRAERHGRTLEDEAREILEGVLTIEELPEVDLGTAIHRIFARYGGVELPEVTREPIGDLPTFE
jgi:plasmid stability protein